LNRIDAQFARLREAKQGAFCPYVCAGDPDLAVTAELIAELARRGADCIELGVPFSDPIADGPVLQAATQRALRGGVTMRRILAMVRALRRGCTVPMALMSYYNPIHRYGVKRLVDDAVSAGIDGFIVPDLPPEDAGELIAAARGHDAKTIFFIAPTTPAARVKQIDRATTGFVYCLSVTGITGARRTLPAQLRRDLKRLKGRTHHPLVVGFGVSVPQQVRQMCAVADGVIVGSAMTAQMQKHIAAGVKTMIRRVGEYAAEMARAAHGR
jgi:tryptophan synthase alpha chain